MYTSMKHIEDQSWGFGRLPFSSNRRMEKLSFPQVLELVCGDAAPQSCGV